MQMDFLSDMMVSIISKEPAERLLELIRMGHPNQCGEPYSRFDVIKEIERRHREVFEAFGWPMDPDSIYKNRYTAREQTLHRRYEERAGYYQKHDFSEWLRENSPFILEHWYPLELWEPSALHHRTQLKLFYT